MNESDKILDRLNCTLNTIDNKLQVIGYGDGKPHASPQKFYEEMIDLKKFEEKLIQQERIIAAREKELAETWNNLIIKQQKDQTSRRILKEECLWIEKEAKYQFCKNFILEIAFKIQEAMLIKEEQLIKQSREISLLSFEKLNKSLTQFETLKNNFKNEAQSLTESQKIRKKKRLENPKQKASLLVTLQRNASSGTLFLNSSLSSSSHLSKDNNEKNKGEMKSIISYLNKKLNEP